MNIRKEVIKWLYGIYGIVAYTTTSITGHGIGALKALTSGVRNTAVGNNALNAITTGNDCTAVGAQALLLATGNQNTAVGSLAGDAITTGTENTAFGYAALSAISTASGNTAVGANALLLATGTNNTAVGGSCLDAVSSGANNTGVGTAALGSLSTNSNCTAVGAASLPSATGGGNTALGSGAGNVVTTGTNNTCIGQSADVSTGAASAQTAIGSAAVCTANNQVMLGTSAEMITKPGANGSACNLKTISENITIAAAATSDSAADLLPADSLIVGVTYRVTTLIPTAATFDIGDASTAAKFGDDVLVAAGTTGSSLTLTAAQTLFAQSAAAKIRITPNLTPGDATGRVRVCVFYYDLTPPTS